ncbi:hypothetical protein BJ912DRAFT_995615 [Pholiota molesta]|nr:hypothetical protein BJ912DRAFT_995615 [Pholiota molesta]
MTRIPLGTHLPGSKPLRVKHVPVLFSSPCSPREWVDGQQARVRLVRQLRGLRERLDERVRGEGEPRGRSGGLVVLSALQASSLRSPATFAAVAWHLTAVSGLVQPFFGVQCRARSEEQSLPAMHRWAMVVRPGLKGREIPAELTPTSESLLVLSGNQPLILTIQWGGTPLKLGARGDGRGEARGQEGEGGRRGNCKVRRDCGRLAFT